MIELIEQSRMAIDELIDVMGRASVEAVLGLSARQVAGEPQQGKARTSEVGWYGTQPGRVNLKERKMRVQRPRLRQKGRGIGRESPYRPTKRCEKTRAPVRGCWRSCSTVFRREAMSE